MKPFRQRMHDALDRVYASKDEDTEASLMAEVKRLEKEFHAVIEAATARGALDYTPEERAVKERFKAAEAKLAEFTF